MNSIITGMPGINAIASRNRPGVWVRFQMLVAHERLVCPKLKIRADQALIQATFDIEVITTRVTRARGILLPAGALVNDRQLAIEAKAASRITLDHLSMIRKYRDTVTLCRTFGAL